MSKRKSIVFSGAFLTIISVASASTVNFASVDFRTAALPSGTFEALAIRDTVGSAGTAAQKNNCMNSQTAACLAVIQTGATFETGTYTGSAATPNFTKSAAPTIDVDGDPIASLTNVNGIPVNWSFDSSTYPSVPAGLSGPLAAHMYISITTTPGSDHATGPHEGTVITDLAQPFNTVGHLYITLDTPWDNPGTPGNDGLFVLLSADFQAVLKSSGRSTGSFISDSSQLLVTYRSQFLNFVTPASVERDFAFSFSSATPCISRRAGAVSSTNAGCYAGTADDQYLRNFVATGNGQFGSDPRPDLIGTVPEPMTLLMLGTGLIGLAVASRSKFRG